MTGNFPLSCFDFEEFALSYVNELAQPNLAPWNHGHATEIEKTKRGNRLIEETEAHVLV